LKIILLLSIFILIIPILPFCTASDNAAIIFVDDESDCPGDGSKEWPYCKIHYAIDNASDGDIIQVYPGIYY
jgi:hypothetical protein